MTTNLHPSRRPRAGAFTLIELLTVIAIIAVLAAMLIPVVGAVQRQKYLNAAKAELQQLQTAIDNYHATYGFYPPGNPNNVMVNQLYYELLGTGPITNNAGAVTGYTNLDGSSLVSVGTIGTAFGGASGFVNCTKTSANSEDAVTAKNFIGSLKPNRIGVYGGVSNLVTSVGGPDPGYMPLGVAGLNPFRYNAANPTNNPTSYDLWIDLSIQQKTNRICNWSRQVLQVP